MLPRTGRRDFIRSCGAFGCVLIRNPINLFQKVHASRDPVAIWHFDQRAGARTLESANRVVLRIEGPVADLEPGSATKVCAYANGNDQRWAQGSVQLRHATG